MPFLRSKKSMTSPLVWQQQVWDVWTLQQTQTYNTYSSTSNIVWNSWLEDTGTGATNLQYQDYRPWATWNQTIVVPKNWSVWVQRQDETLEARQARLDWERAQREEHERQEAARRERYAEMERERTVANTKAHALLKHILGDEDYGALMDGGLVVVGASGRRYRIQSHGQSGNVHVLGEADASVARLCAHPGGYLPLADHLLAQVLHLRSDDEEFVSVANVHQGQLPDELRARREARRLHIA